jgi:hypothetical protein
VRITQEFDLKPGENVLATEFRYEPDDANDTTAQMFLTRFIQSGDNLDLSVEGDKESTPFGSLQVALDGVTLETSITGLNHPNIIARAHVTITLESLVTNLVSVEFFVTNPLDADMVIEFVQASSGLDGTTYAFFRQSFDNFVIPPGQTVSSGQFGNVLLPQGAVNSLVIIPRGVLDISAANTVRIGGKGGYEIPWLKLEQTNVPTTYDLSLSGAATSVDGLLKKAKEILHPSSSNSSISSMTRESTGGATAAAGDGSSSKAATTTAEKTTEAAHPLSTAAKETSTPAANGPLNSTISQ